MQRGPRRPRRWGLGGPGHVLGLTVGLHPWEGAPVVCRGFTTGAVCVVGCEAPAASRALVLPHTATVQNGGTRPVHAADPPECPGALNGRQGPTGVSEGSAQVTASQRSAWQVNSRPCPVSHVKARAKIGKE